MVLTFDEGEVMDVLRRYRSEVDASVIRREVWEQKRVTYDRAQRAMRGTVEKGLAVKVRRGVYQLAHLERDA